LQKNQIFLIQDIDNIKFMIENYINVLSDDSFVKHKDDIELITIAIHNHPDENQSIRAIIIKE
jgi:hypothetical protein